MEDQLLGKIIKYNDIDYIVVSELGNELWLFKEESAKTYKIDEDTIIVINLEELNELELEEDNECEK